MALAATKLTDSPAHAIIKNATRILVACEIKPIKGGVNKKPKKPMVETVATAILDGIRVVFPAKL